MTECSQSPLFRQNNFQTMRECMTMCRDVGPASPEPDQTIDCSAPPVSPNSRSCSDSIVRYYYSVPEGRCVRLLYGGCGATDNNFATMTECERSCPPGSVNQTGRQGGGSRGDEGTCPVCVL